MAEVKREVIEHIFSIKKDNAQEIQLNIMKWGRNSQKYDLRIWDEDKPLKGITLSDKELKELCNAFGSKFGESKREVIRIPADKDEFDIKQIEVVDLQKVISDYPECTYDYNKLRGILRDRYPKNSREVNLILNVFHCGIAGQMQKLQKVSQSDMNRFVRFMENEFGVMDRYTVGAVMLWAKALNIKCQVNLKEFAHQEEKKEGVKEEVEKKKAGRPRKKKEDIYKFGDLVYEDNMISISYQGVYKFDGLFAQGHRIRFFIENKTKQTMRVSGKNISLNGLVLNSDDLFNSGIEAGRKVVDTVLIYRNNLHAAGIKKVSDMKEGSIQFEYSIGSQKHRTSDIKFLPFEVRE